MKRYPLSLTQRGQVSVETLMLTVVIAGFMIPIVYTNAIRPMLDKMQGQRKNLVDFVAQSNKKPVPSAWFKSEQLARLKDVKEVDTPKEVAVNEVPAPGEVEVQEVKDPKAMNPKGVKDPKPVSQPKGMSVSSNSSQSVGGGGAGGSGSALGSNAQDPEFFGGSKSDKEQDNNAGGGSGMAQGARQGQFNDEYAPKNANKDGSQAASKSEDQKSKEGADGGVDKTTKRNLVLSETRQEEQARSKPFDWWLLIKILILGLIIFLVVLIGLSNMKKR